MTNGVGGCFIIRQGFSGNQVRMLLDHRDRREDVFLACFGLWASSQTQGGMSGPGLKEPHRAGPGT